MPKKPVTLEGLLVEELQDLLDVEKQLIRALPKMVKSASDEELENALRSHLEITKGQLARLEQIFELLGQKPKSRPCMGMKGILEEGKEMLGEDLGQYRDTAITGAARKVEHYEMMGYESAISLAQQLDKNEAAELLRETLREEMQADQQMAELGKRLLISAARTGTAASSAF
ncbi:MAG TPA: ferritin-like domain-containing protein [Bryobacteraceae bacterium]|jgi:ferritin-like metal-binding protein YciE